MRLALAVLLVLLAGCTQPEPTVDEVVPEPEPEPLPDLFGLVLDHNGERLADATVQIEAGPAVRTDGNGSFAFELEPGTYDVQASRDGHRPATVRVEVIDRFAAHIVFTLPTWESLPPMVAVMDHRGFLECGLAGGGFGPDCPTSNGSDRFSVPLEFSDPIEGALLEVFWDPQTLSNGRLAVTVTDSDGTVLVASAGSSPLRMTLDAADVPDMVHVQVMVDDDASAGFAVAQTYEAFLSVFLNDPAPDGYTIRD